MSTEIPTCNVVYQAILNVIKQENIQSINPTNTILETETPNLSKKLTSTCFSYRQSKN